MLKPKGVFGVKLAFFFFFTITARLDKKDGIG